MLTSSTQGIKASGTERPGLQAYAASKRGLVALMQGWASQLAPQSIRVNTIHPSGVATDMIINEATIALAAARRSMARHPAERPAHRAVAAEEIANAVAWLVSDAGQVHHRHGSWPLDAGFTRAVTSTTGDTVRITVAITREMNDVAIIGVGLHPFGRFEGKSAMEMGVDAIFAAVADAGVEWKDVQFATGGSWTVANPDAIVGMVGLSGIPFTNVFNACATAASAAKACADGIRLGDYDIGIAVGLDKHPRGAFTEDPALVGMPSWYAENGQYLTTQFFGMKANRYLHDHGISQQTLAKVAAKNFRNGALNPNAFRRKPIPEDQILNSTMLNYPLTQYMFCAPDEGAAAVVMCRADIAHRYTSKPVYLRAVEVRTRKYGAYEVNTTFAPVEEGVAPTVYAAKAAFEKAGIAPSDVDVIQLQDTDAGAEIIHMAECGFCEHGDQEKLLADGATEIHGSMPINTDGGLIANGEPIGASGLRQIHELVRQLRGEAGERQVAGEPRVGFAQLYGAPGTAAATIVTT